MELIIELPEAELDEVYGGIDFANATFSIIQISRGGDAISRGGDGGNATASGVGGVATGGAGGAASAAVGGDGGANSLLITSFSAMASL
jgi:hypothetical protein